MRTNPNYSTRGLTRGERRILATLPEDWREEYVRMCRLETLAEATGVHPALLEQQLREFVR